MQKNSNQENIIEYFKIDSIMNRLRASISKNLIKDEEFVEIVWLLKILLNSRTVFATTKEVNNLLTNLCGFAHDTKSTGRDRIVDWYFNKIKELDGKEQSIVLKRIAKYTFASIPKDYNDWNDLFLKRRGKK